MGEIIKNLFFILVITFASLETVFHINSLLKNMQPKRKIILPYYLSLSPTILVYDRGFGYFSKLHLTYVFESKTTPVNFIYTENSNDANNYLELIIQRNIQLSFNNEKILNILVKYLLCQNLIESFSTHLPAHVKIKLINLKIRNNVPPDFENTRAVECQK